MNKFLAIVLLLTTVVSVLSVYPVYADHNEETQDYPRTTTPIEIQNNEEGIQVKYLDENDYANTSDTAYKNIVETLFPVETQICTTPESNLMICYFYGYEPEEESLFTTTEDCREQGLELDIQTWTCKPAHQIEQEALENYEQVISQNPEEQEPIELTENEKIIQRLEAKHRITTGDRIAIDLYNRVQMDCLVDITTIQTTRILHDLPTEQVIDPTTGELVTQFVIPNITKSISYDSHPELGKIMLKLQECKAENTLKEDLGFDKKWGTYSNTRLTGDDDIQPYHADIARSVQPIAASQVESMSNEGVKQPRYSPMCYVEHATHQTKMIYGCPDEREYLSTELPPPMKDYADSPALQAWFEYLKDPDSQWNTVVEKNKIKDSQKYQRNLDKQ